MLIDLPTPAPKFINPQQVLSQLDIKEGNIMADLGCGSGYITFEAAKIVGEEGKVYAVDIQKTVLSGIQSKIKLYGTRNIEAVWADLEVLGSTKIKDDSVDVSLLFAVLYQAKEHAKIIAEAKRITKQGGKILIADWTEANVPLGPEVKLRVSKDKIQEKAEAQGLKLSREVEIDEYHYGLLFVK